MGPGSMRQGRLVRPRLLQRGPLAAWGPLPPHPSMPDSLLQTGHARGQPLVCPQGPPHLVPGVLCLHPLHGAPWGAHWPASPLYLTPVWVLPDRSLSVRPSAVTLPILAPRGQMVKAPPQARAPSPSWGVSAPQEGDPAQEECTVPPPTCTPASHHTSDIPTHIQQFSDTLTGVGSDTLWGPRSPGPPPPRGSVIC